MQLGHMYWQSLQPAFYLIYRGIIDVVKLTHTIHIKSTNSLVSI